MSAHSDDVYAPERVEGSIADKYPVAGTVDPSLAISEPDGVDVDAMPEFRDVRRLRPSARMAFRAKLSEVAAKVPEDAGELTDVDLEKIDQKNAAVVTEKIQGIAGLFEDMENLIFDLAVDAEAMESWLVDQADPEAAIAYAFSVAASSLGKVS